MTAANSKKTAPGRPWKKGQSGNPHGRPKKVRELLERARASVPKAIEYAERLLDDEEADERLRLDAAKFLASYGLGGPPKSTSIVDDDDDVQTSAGLDLETSRKIVGLALVKKKDEPSDDS